MYQDEALVITLILMGTLVAGYVFVGLRSLKRHEDYAPIQKRAYRVRSLLFWTMMVTLTPLLFFTLTDLPYAATHEKPRQDDVAEVINVKGRQWYWQMSRDQIEVGKLVEFHVTSDDVNHGFGIYDENMRIVAQTMAMPDYTNKLRHTFTQPGTYKILCLEYCGLVHHNMTAEFKVVAESAARETK